jgi:dTDP-4-amino-4,6-dideoxy-D-galactose acyltransferase
MTDNDPGVMLTWDTEFFGFPIGRVRSDTMTPGRAKEIDLWARGIGVRCLYFLARVDDLVTIVVAERNGYHLVDIRVTLANCVSPDATTKVLGRHEGIKTRLALANDIPFLQEIAQECHHDSRFYFDDKFPCHSIDALYKTWIAKSCAGYADAVLLAERNGTPVAYITCHVNEDQASGRIGLAGVHKSFQGQGLGPALVNRAQEWFALKGIWSLEVVTQGRNIAAQRMYQRCGFLTSEIQLWYHKWYSESESF